ncbi:NADH-quinone oxidoreductase subunit L [Halalkalicoccus ordinarius]|uniref:NADH-quinone oxidoreductase subunit L n=1 Tax=Halalkalicoccus ordinarius TaxID=3116651 RepID=UPI00300F15BB
MVGVFDYAPLIALFPLASFVIALAAGRYLPKRGGYVGVIATGGSLLLSLWAMLAVAGGEFYDRTIYTWVTGVGEETISLTFGILIDPLSSMMLVIVSLIAMLVHVFSLGYMNDEGETGLPRYYAGLGLFTFSMLGFVLANNLLMAFMFFELVGLCSWLLIGFWFREEAPPSGAKKAFLVTRFGDYFFLIGVVGILATFGTAQFAGDGSFPQLALEAVEGGETLFGYDAQTWVTVLGLLVLGGVMGKSAQFPLHTWLPDAMEGPTPVSALIHAATMVAAGVFLVARMFGFYALSPTALSIIAFTGAFTALFAATMGVVKDDIKQVLAYSTISQYGYMMLGLGVAGYVAATFHLMTHAFFKALLFLGAGAVIIGMHHEQDMWKMGGLKDEMPVTYYTFLAGSLALAGIFPFSGFWSKDEIVYDALIVGLDDPIMLAAYAMGLLAVFFTGFYTFRMVLLTFHGEPRSDHAEHPVALRWNTKLPLVVLGILAVVAGFVNMVPVAELTGADITYLTKWLDSGPEALSYSTYTELAEEFGDVHHAELSPLIAGAVTFLFALAGVGTAVALYRGPAPERHTDRLGAAKTVLASNYYQDEYQVWLAEGLTRRVARGADTFDQSVVDGVVNGTSSVSLTGSDRLRRLQTGVVTNYAALIATSLVVLLIGFGIYGGWF